MQQPFQVYLFAAATKIESFYDIISAYLFPELMWTNVRKLPLWPQLSLTIKFPNR